MKSHPVAQAPLDLPSARAHAQTVARNRTIVLLAATAAVLAVGAGCSSDSSSRPLASNSTVPITVVEQPKAVEVSPTVPDAPQVAVASVAPPAAEVPPPAPPPRLTASAEEVVQLAQARVGEDVLLAYISGVEAPFELDSDAIVYLTDLGVPAETIATMVRRDQVLKGRAVLEGTTTAEVADAATEAQPVPLEAQTVESVAAESAPESMAVAEAYPIETAEAVAAEEPVTQVTNNYFYDTLSPYGTWVDIPDYGWCWQPSVALAQPDWRPYCNGGRWIWTDCGWYWQSYYSWGWAPFHYGRWHLSPSCGWVWSPGTYWAPAWVTWRYYDGYCGWAPLPPAAYYTSGIGITYYGSRVGFGIGFGLSAGCYSFVPTRCFYNSRPWNYCVPRSTVNKFYGNTTIINNYVYGDNNRIINRGIGTDTIAAATRTEIRKVRVTDAAGVGARGAVRAERLSRDGTTLATYRPRLPTLAGQPPAAVTRRQEQAAQRSANLIDSKAVAAARLRASSTSNRALLSSVSPNPLETAAAPARVGAQPSTQPARAADTTRARSNTLYSREDRALPVQAQRESVQPRRTEPRRASSSTAAPTVERSAVAQSPSSSRTVSTTRRVEPRASRSPAPRTPVTSQTERRSTTVINSSVPRTSTRITTQPRVEPRRISPTVEIPQRTIRSTPTRRAPTYQPSTTQRSVSPTFNPRSTPSRTYTPRSAPTPRSTYTPRSAPAPRSTYSPPPSTRSRPASSPRPSTSRSSVRSSTPSSSRSTSTPRSAPSSPSRSGGRTVQRR